MPAASEFVPRRRTNSQRWEVQAWVEAPGEFPSRSLESVTVLARDVDIALKRAGRRFAEIGLDPIVVSVVRVRPPADRNE